MDTQANTAMEPSATDANAMTALLEQMGAADPRLQMIMELMRRQPATETRSRPADERRRLQRALVRYEQLHEQYDILRERNETLASALGACPYCWGEVEECEACRGRGAPGTYRPDADVFVEYVLPAIRRLRSFQRESRDRPPLDAAQRDLAGTESRQRAVNSRKEDYDGLDNPRI